LSIYIEKVLFLPGFVRVQVRAASGFTTVHGAGGKLPSKFCVSGKAVAVDLLNTDVFASLVLLSSATPLGNEVDTNNVFEPFATVMLDRVNVVVAFGASETAKV
jgi:hypothetical protein